ncbi:MAG: MmcB family DNA repair protein [Methylocella sp.]
MPGLPKPFSPRDGRQSGTALIVARGTRRLLRQLNFSTVTELPLLSGRRADIVALAMDATIFVVEIKSSVADFRADTKWRAYRAHCDRLFFAIPETVPIEIMPEDAGLILADGYGAEILRQAPEHRIAAATRRAVLMRFAHAAADRLHRLSDPEGRAGRFERVPKSCRVLE